MYIYLENNYFIPIKEIVAIIKYLEFQNSILGNEFLKSSQKEIINISKNSKKTVIITEKYTYISSYEVRSLYSRGKEYNRLITIKNKYNHN